MPERSIPPAADPRSTRQMVPGLWRGDRLLALLLSAVTNADSSDCTDDPCALCTAAQEAQTYLNDLCPDMTTGWWWEESNAAVVAAVEALASDEQERDSRQ